MENKNLISDIKTMSEQVNRIFYFVNPEGLQFKSKRQEEIASKMAEHLGITLYGERSGPEINNPATFLDELTVVGIEKFDIIYFSEETEEISLLSHKMKEQMLINLRTPKEGENSGMIAKKIADTEETDWVY